MIISELSVVLRFGRKPKRKIRIVRSRVERSMTQDLGRTEAEKKSEKRPKKHPSCVMLPWALLTGMKLNIISSDIFGGPVPDCLFLASGTNFLSSYNPIY